MSSYRATCVSLAFVAIFASAAPSALAQPLGTFRWQFAPYCNVVTLLVVRQQNTFALSGTDNQCGAAVAAAAAGTAFFHPNGSIGIALSVTRPDGLVLSSTIDFELATMSGLWRDDARNSGIFQFSPLLSPPGAPRRITLRGVYSAGFIAVQPNQPVITNISFGRTLASAPAAPQVNIIPINGVATANCPGSFDDPRAEPGQLCPYERFRLNISAYQVASSAGADHVADTIGAHLVIASEAAGSTSLTGAWAVTIP